MIPKRQGTTAQQIHAAAGAEREGEPLDGHDVMLSNAVMASGKVLGKVVGQEALSFQMRDAPLDIYIAAHAPAGAGLALGQART